MRELKFRVWDKENNCFFKPTYEAYRGRLEDLSIDLSGDLTMRTYDNPAIHESVFPNRFVIQQYTGLKDKNGKEIYDGDILTSTIYPFQSDKEYNYHGEVNWGEEDAAFLLTKHVVNKSSRGISHGITDLLTDYDMRVFEVIGNIFVNKNLLVQS